MSGLQSLGAGRGVDYKGVTQGNLGVINLLLVDEWLCFSKPIELYNTKTEFCRIKIENTHTQTRVSGKPKMECKLWQISLTALQMDDIAKWRRCGRKDLTYLTLEKSILAGYCENKDKKNCTQWILFATFLSHRGMD